MIRTLTALALLSCFAATPAFAQAKPMPPEEIAQIKADVIKAAHNYMTTFSALDFKAIADNVYSHPAVTINAEGVKIIDPVAQAAQIAKNVEGYKKTGWVKSDFPNPVVCVVNANVAIMSTKFRRLDKDNKVIMEGAETDIFARTADGWKMVALFGHSPHKVVTCND